MMVRTDIGQKFGSGLGTRFVCGRSMVSRRSQDVGVTADSCHSLAGVFLRWVSALSMNQVRT